MSATVFGKARTNAIRLYSAQSDLEIIDPNKMNYWLVCVHDHEDEKIINEDNRKL